MPSLEEHVFKDTNGESHILKIKRFDRDFLADQDKCERDVLLDRLSKEAYKLYVNSGRKTKIIFENDKIVDSFEQLIKSDAKEMMGIEVNNVLLDYPWYPIVQRALLKMDEKRVERDSETNMILKKSSHEILIDDFKYPLKDFWDFRAQTGCYNRSLASSNLLKGTVQNKWKGRNESLTSVISQMDLLENGDLRNFTFVDTKNRERVLQIRRFDCIWDWDVKMLALAQEAFILFKESEGDIIIILDKNRSAHKALISQENLDETLAAERKWAYIVSWAILGVFWLASSIATAIWFSRNDEPFEWNNNPRDPYWSNSWTIFTVTYIFFIVGLFVSILWVTSAELRTTLTLNGKTYSLKEFNLFRKLIGAAPLYVPDVDHTLADHSDF